MALKNSFVGREPELQVIRQLLQKSPKKNQIVFILGDGGMGKTKLVRKMLDEARACGALAAEEPIDFFSTNFRHIDGIQWKIKEVVENLPIVRAGPSPFVNFIKGKTDTSENFYECLKKFCAEHQLVLAFDTFENLDKVASDWLFKSDKGGLQVPGLVCVVAGRPEKNDLDLYRKNPLVKEVQISGFTHDEAEEFYRSISDEFKLGSADPLDELLKAAGLSLNDPIPNSIEWLREVTLGHPLRLEMAFRWSGTLLREETLKNLLADKFEERLMSQVRELEARGLLDVGPLKVSQPVYDTLVCMAYVTRRFDEDFLRYLIEKELIRLSGTNVSEKDILDNLEKYFFVKVRDGSGTKPVFQLHDEMARLVREYVWPFQDNAVVKKQELLAVVDQYYDQLITLHTRDATDILWVEKLYYTLQRDWKIDGKRLWKKLVDMDNDNINKLLPGEIKGYIKYYDSETQFQIYDELGRIERTARHINQAMGYFGEAKKLAEKELGPLNLVKALEGLASCYEPRKALKQYKENKIICEREVPERIPDAYYNIGYTYRRMQNIKMAITWYRKATDQFRMHPRSKGLQAKIANDLGYMYSIVGEWGEAKKAVDEGLRLRKEILWELENEIKQKQNETLQNHKSDQPVTDGLNLLEERRKAAYYLGLSYSTLGEIYRYQNELDDALRSYTDAYTLFEQVSNEDWQARTLYSLGETNRRLAENKDLTEEKRQEYIDRALENIEQSLYLCERYQLQDSDTANRRMGRLYHDLALYALKKGGIALAQDHLDKASLYFKKGLVFAHDSNDVLEELENLAELAFIVDDFMLIASQKSGSKKYQEPLDSFKKVLDQHRKDKFRIYQFPVFESLYILEKAATYYRMGKYKEALDAYLKANIGLATSPGYGQARYKQHFDHLTRQIENLKSNEAENWCRAFIQAWESTRAPGKRSRTLAQEILPDLVVWCNRHLEKIRK